LREILALDAPVQEWAKEEGIADEEIRERIRTAVDEIYAQKRQTYTPEIMVQIEKAVLLQTLDHLWREHILTVEHLRQVIHLRGYGQRDPLNEYKTEGFALFESMMSRLREMTTSQIIRVEIQQRPTSDMLPSADDLPVMELHHIDATTGEDDAALAALFAPSAGGSGPLRDPRDPRTWGKIGRNEACPCGSGKKYKHCHGAFA
jgi:preprotein translocase subunit SecA